MDELAEDTLENSTAILDHERPAFLYVFDAFNVTTCLLGLAADILLIYTITSSRQLRSRTNTILMNWAISHALFLFSKTTFLANTVIALAVHHTAFCVLRHAHDTYEVIGTVFMGALLLDHVVKAKQISTATILLVVYVGCIGFGMVHIIVCSYFHFLSVLSSLVIFGALALAVLTKEVVRYRRGIPNRRALRRLNIARIYVYSWLICFSLELPFLFELHEGFILFFLVLSLLGYLIPVYLLVYLYRTDKVFKICTLNLFRKEENRYNVDDTIGFEDLSDEEVEEQRQGNQTSQNVASLNGANKEVNA